MTYGELTKRLATLALVGTALSFALAIAPTTPDAHAQSCSSLGSQFSKAQNDLAKLNKQADSVYNQFQKSYQKAKQLEAQINFAGCNRQGSNSNVCAPLERQYANERRKYQDLQNQHNALVSQQSRAERQVAALQPQVQQCIQRASAPPPPPRDCRRPSAFAPPPPGCEPQLTPAQQAQQRQNEKASETFWGLVGAFGGDRAVQGLLGGGNNNRGSPDNGGCPSGSHPKKDGTGGCDYGNN